MESAEYSKANIVEIFIDSYRFQPIHQHVYKSVPFFRVSFQTGYLHRKHLSHCKSTQQHEILRNMDRFNNPIYTSMLIDSLSSQLM